MEEAQAKLDLWTRRKAGKTTAPQLVQVAAAEEEEEDEEDAFDEAEEEEHTIVKAVEEEGLVLDESDVVVPKAKGRPRKSK